MKTEIEKIVTNEVTAFMREKIATIEKMSLDCLTDLKLELGQDTDDYLGGVFTARLQAFIYQNTIAERDLVYYCDRPTFLDWLLRRKKKVVFKFKAKDLLIKPPKTEKPTLRIYEIKESE
jgi:hypothetical protein